MIIVFFSFFVEIIWPNCTIIASVGGNISCNSTMHTIRLAQVIESSAWGGARPRSFLGFSTILANPHGTACTQAIRKKKRSNTRAAPFPCSLCTDGNSMRRPRRPRGNRNSVMRQTPHRCTLGGSMTRRQSSTSSRGTTRADSPGFPWRLSRTMRPRRDCRRNTCLANSRTVCRHHRCLLSSIAASTGRCILDKGCNACPRNMAGHHVFGSSESSPLYSIQRQKTTNCCWSSDAWVRCSGARLVQ